jgi:F-box and WD-40 domain protein 1/11
VFEGVHTESVLSLCVRNGWMASAGSDWRVVLWNLNRRIWEEASSESDASANAVVNVLKDHGDSVLCVRFDEKRLVSCSKGTSYLSNVVNYNIDIKTLDRTVRVYSFPDLELLHILSGHWAAVNAISLCENIVVSGSGDRCMNVWDVETGKLLRTFSDHHTRGCAFSSFFFHEI